MKCKYLLLLLPIAALPTQAHAQRFSLSSAQNFAVLGGSTVTNTGSSVIKGDLGVSPGSSLIGFPPGIVTPPGTIHSADALAQQAQQDALTSFTALNILTPTQDLTGQDLGGKTLLPGVYDFTSSAGLTGTLTLDTQGNPDALFVFQIGSTLTTATDSKVVVLNGDGCNIFWAVGTSATLGTRTSFQGSILADDSITLNSGAAIISGRALAQEGAVTLDTNTISLGNCPFVQSPAGTFSPAGTAPVPEASTTASFGLLLALGMGGVVIAAKRKKTKGKALV